MTCSTARTRHRRRPSSALVALLTVLSLGLGACGGVSMPKVSMPKLPDFGRDEETPQEVAPTAETADVTATPRDLLTARLANPRPDPASPPLTVGKLIEFADRYLACDCSKSRFVRSWARTSEGYRLTTNSDATRPLEFVCRDAGDERECYLTEIDRGTGTENFAQRFVPGAEFIQFLYDNGVRCEREEPCP